MPQHDNTARDDRWKIGDKALCIKTGVWMRATDDKKPISGPGTPQFGKEYTVSGFRFIGRRGLFLRFEEIRQWCWAERYFMKSTPPEDMEVDVYDLPEPNPAKEIVIVS